MEKKEEEEGKEKNKRRGKGIEQSIWIWYFRVIAVDIAKEKLEMASKLGADITVNTMEQDLYEVSLFFFGNWIC